MNHMKLFLFVCVAMSGCAPVDVGLDAGTSEVSSEVQVCGNTIKCHPQTCLLWCALESCTWVCGDISPDTCPSDCHRPIDQAHCPTEANDSDEDRCWNRCSIIAPANSVQLAACVASCVNEIERPCVLGPIP